MKGKSIQPYMLLLPAILLASAFSIMPFMRSLVLSFLRITPRGTIIGPAGLDNFISLFRDAAFRDSIMHTIIFIALFLPLNTFLTLLAAILTRRKRRYGAAFEYMFFTPLAVSMAAYAMIFSEMFRGRVSIINRIFGTEIIWLDSPMTAMATLVMLSVFLDFGLDYMLLLSSFRSIDRSMIEAAEIDGAGGARMLFSIELPQIRPMLLVTVFMAAKDAALISAPVMVLTQGGPFRSTETIMYYYYLEAFRSANVQAGRAISVMMVALSVLLMALAGRKRHE